MAVSGEDHCPSCGSDDVAWDSSKGMYICYDCGENIYPDELED